MTPNPAIHQIDPYLDTIKRVISLRIRNRDDQEDILSLVYWKVMRAKTHVQPTNLRNWFLSVTSSAIIDFTRNNKRMETGLDREADATIVGYEETGFQEIEALDLLENSVHTSIPDRYQAAVANSCLELMQGTGYRTLAAQHHMGHTTLHRYIRSLGNSLESLVNSSIKIS